VGAAKVRRTHAVRETDHTSDPAWTAACGPREEGTAMANVNAADVKRLRDATGAGMMDCKKALEAVDGDFDAAVTFLREKGQKDVTKRQGRTASNGLVAVSGAAMVEIATETDFVAKSAELQTVAQQVADAVAAGGSSELVDVAAETLPDGATVSDTIAALNARLGEKIELRRVVLLEGTIATYLHRRDPGLPPQVGVLVSYTADGDRDTAQSTARGAAMQVAAMRASYLRREEVPDGVVAAERDIAANLARNEGKPEAALSRIVEGRLNGFFKDAVLLEQESVMEPKRTVAEVLSDGGVTVTGFAHFEVGAA